jgi:hypothetical protein
MLVDQNTEAIAVPLNDLPGSKVPRTGLLHTHKGAATHMCSQRRFHNALTHMCTRPHLGP